MNILFVGGGNMASALIGGLLGNGYDRAALAAVDPLEPARARLAEAFGIAAGATLADPGLDPAGAGMIVLAVKPQQMREAAAALRPYLRAQLVVSIAAGIRTGDLSRWLGGHERIVRAMPNTPALVRAGITGLYARPAVDATDRDGAEAVLRAVGGTIWVDDERMIDAVTAVSGSGPAYVFYFIEALRDAAREIGFDPAAANALAQQTFSGAALLAATASEDVAVLRRNVTSKGGTTERALAALEARGVRAHVAEAVRAAMQRGIELGDELGERTEVLNQAIAFIAETLLGLFSLALLLRFYLQLVRAPYRNPVSQFLCALTDFVVIPARRVVPGLWGTDLATLVLAWLTQVLLLAVLVWIGGGAAGAGLLALAAVKLLRISVYIVMVAVIVQALLSWVNPYSPVAPLLASITRPFLAPLQRRLPLVANVDLSPLVLIILLQLVLMVPVAWLEAFAARLV